MAPLSANEKEEDPPSPLPPFDQRTKSEQRLLIHQTAALLSFSVLHNCSTDHGPDQIPFQGTKTTFPTLTEEEKQTSLGASLLFIKGLLHNMTDVLLKERHGLSNVPNSNVDEYDTSSSSEEDVACPAIKL